MAKQHRSTWVRHERRIAEAVGGKRTGNTGQPGADVVTDIFAIECKSWRRLPAKVLGALAQAERSASGSRVAVAVLHQVGSRHDDDLVVVRWRDFAALLLGEHATDRRVAARVAALVQMDGATPDEWAVLAPDGD